MDAVTTRYFRILRFIRRTDVSSSPGDVEQETSRIDSGWRAIRKVSPSSTRFVYRLFCAAH